MFFRLLNIFKYNDSFFENKRRWDEGKEIARCLFAMMFFYRKLYTTY